MSGNLLVFPVGFVSQGTLREHIDQCGSMGSCSNTITKLAEGSENEGEAEEDKNGVSQDDVGTFTNPVPKWTPSASKLSVSLQGLRGSSNFHSGLPMNLVSNKTDESYSDHSTDHHQSGGWSANEMLPPSSSFMKLSDMSVSEWTAFLEKFQEFLRSMFHDRKQSAARRPWLTQRLGTSCQF